MYLAWNKYATTTAPTGTYLKLYGGGCNGCGIRNDGTADCWGLNDEQQTDNSWGSVRTIVPTQSSICAVSKSGVVDCAAWITSSEAYRWFDGSFDVVQLVEAQNYGCVLRTDGTLDFKGKTITPPSSVPKFKAISGGYYHLCGIVASDGSLLCWENAASSCGAGNVPTNLGSVRQVVAGYDFTCVVTEANKVKCWGCSMAQYASTFEALTDVERIAAGSAHACAMQSTGNVVCWGNNSNGQIDVPADFRL
jgi:alpha-tubulin suppressor-like RCC1 family protein